MKSKFGFEIKEGRHIDLDTVDTRMAEDIVEAVGSWKACINCGSCSATCPGGVNFRAIHLMLSTLGEMITSDGMASLNSCLLCGKCFLVCPRGISTRYLIIQIMKKQKEYGKAV
ncbi:MAG: 4Fe-4S dicluster domain-containing protein [Bacteroidota bacterium]